MNLTFSRAVDQPDTERFLLIQRDYSSNDRYGHLIAYVVRRAKSDCNNPDRPGEVLYGDGANATGYRTCDWSSSKKSAVLVRDFRVRCQITRHGAEADWEKKPYAVRHMFYDTREVTRRAAELMLATYKKVDSYCDKLDIQYGHVAESDFAGYCIRVARALGINRALFYKDGHSGRGLIRDDDFLTVEMPRVTDYVLHEISRLLEQR